MSDRRIKVFHAVAKHLSFTKAAEILFMSQPAVTFQIRQLEDYLNARLFDRTHRGVALTAAGAVVLEYADRMLEMSAELKTRLKEMGGQIGGQLLIGASTTYAGMLVPRVLVEFKSRYPAVVPHLTVANSETIQERLLDRTFNIGFIEGEAQHPALVAEVCCTDELQLVCSPSHPLAREDSVSADLLTRYPCVSREAGSGNRKAIDYYLQGCGLSPGVLQVVMEASSPDAVKALVIAGAGFAIMSRTSVHREAKLEELRRIPLSPRLLRPVSMVYPRERIHSRLISGFLAFAKESIAAMRMVEEVQQLSTLISGSDVTIQPGRARARPAAHQGSQSKR